MPVSARPNSTPRRLLKMSCRWGLPTAWSDGATNRQIIMRTLSSLVVVLPYLGKVDSSGALSTFDRVRITS